MATALHAHRIPKSILKRPDSPKKRGNVIFSAVVTVIGQEYTEPLIQGNDDDLKLDVLPTKNAVVTPPNTPAPSPVTPMAEPTKAEPVRTESRGTMRIKGASVKDMIGQFADPTPAPAPTLIPAAVTTSPSVVRKPSIKEGFLKLLKDSGMKTSWMKRYIVLDRSTIAYYRANDAPKALKSFDLHGDCFVRELKEKMGVADCKNVLEVFIDKKNAIVLQATSQRELTEWITAICGVIDTFNSAALEDDDYEFYDEEEEEGDRFDVPFSESISTHSKTPTIAAAAVIPFSISNSVTTSNELDDEDDYEWIDEDDVKSSNPDTPFPAKDPVPTIDHKKKEQELAKQKEFELAKQKEQELAKQKEQELAKKKEQDLARQKEQELAKQKEQELAKKKEQELALKKEQDLARQKEQELAKQKELELAKKKEQELAKQKESELAKKKEQELTKQKELELARQKEQELARQKEQELALKKEQELARQKELELAKKKEQELAKQKELELAKKKEQELAKQKEQELARQREEEKEREREALRQKESELNKQIEVAREREQDLVKQREDQLKTPATAAIPNSNAQQKLLPTVKKVPAPVGRKPRTGTLPPTLSRPAGPGTNRPPTAAPSPAIVSTPTPAPQPAAPVVALKPVGQRSQTNPPKPANQNAAPAAVPSNAPVDAGVDQSRANKVSNLLKMFENR